MLVRRWPFVLLLGLFFSLQAQAHLMVAQHGTLKLGKGGYYFVLSLPVDALDGIDDNNDGLLSAAELKKNQDLIEQAVHKGFVLEGELDGLRPIEGLLLNLPHDHNYTQTATSHVVAMGRFAVPNPNQKITLMTTLFGHSQEEKQFQISITKGKQKQTLVLGVDSPKKTLFLP